MESNLSRLHGISPNRMQFKHIQKLGEQEATGPVLGLVDQDMQLLDGPPMNAIVGFELSKVNNISNTPLGGLGLEKASSISVVSGALSINAEMDRAHVLSLNVKKSKNLKRLAREGRGQGMPQLPVGSKRKG
ncbi:hypothetical protein LOK49_LG14G02139 [Camellia lanceoleosa]|uniref:Uncharacterized protein n=1 Tax=Camellia lanceoleosa TaxID=1840588 RepID=A0ACC0F945_9ERIC|nr:hypothetical protein LOK49_LG14G02139 [Camellia lanceoleosa]